MSEEDRIVHRNSKTGIETSPDPIAVLKRTRKPRVSSETKQKQKRQRKSGASAEIDKQLAEHIRERSIVSKHLSAAQGKLQEVSDRYNRLTQEINELMNMQGRMNVPLTVGTTVPLALMPTAGTMATPVIGQPVPAGVGSIPARQPASNPAGNVADLAKDRDFV